MKILPSIVITIGVLCLLSGCQVPSGMPPPPTNSPEQEIANPASENCIKQGGTLWFQERGDGGQYGICLFEDNRQCEEWALLRGDCPVGGLKVTGYITPAAQYCAITGGEYQITGISGSEDEQGTCTFKDGSQCDAWEYYNGICLPGNSANEAEATSEWQAFTNTEAGFIIQVPLNWSQQTLPDQNDGAIHGESFTGPEGGTEVYWGIGFGGACSAGTEPVQLSQAEVEACHARNSDGTEIWEQIGYEMSGGNSFSVRAYTSNAEPASHDLVLQVLSTLTFMLPEQLQAGLTIQPLPVEVCDGQAQAMAHALNVLEVTQSEEPLEDLVSGVKGIGCQATVTGNGSQFESPEAVVNTLGTMMEEQGWTHDPMLVVGSSIGTGKGYRKDDQICLATAVWHPQDPTLCPDDQEITECQLEPEQKIYTITLNCGVETPQGGANIEVVSEQIVFDSTRAGDYRNLYLMNSQGKDLSRLTRAEADNLAGPWSPDGKRIIYTAFGLTNSYIAVVNADGSGQGTLSEVQGSDEGFPAWSPDGQRIAFTSRRDGNNEIYLMNADGSNPVRLTDEPGDDFAPSWSPDGSQIVFVSDRDHQVGIYDLYIMNADDREIKRLTNDTFLDYSPDWSPDGTRIVFRSHHGGPADIYVINVDGSGMSALTDDPAEDWAPSWSPNGSRIAFQTNRDGNWEIYIMEVDGSAQMNITNDPSDDQMPNWQTWK